jgi:tetratricopeptide (TPR) repeat protein
MEFRCNLSLNDINKRRPEKGQGLSETQPQSARNRHFLISGEKTTAWLEPASPSKVSDSEVESQESRHETEKGEMKMLWKLEMAKSLHKLAKYCMSQDKYREAEPLLRRVLAIRLEVLGVKHCDTAASLHWLADCCMSQDKYREAEPFLVQAKDICEEVLGLEHRDTAASLHKLADCCISQGKDSEAEPFLVQAKDICEKVLGQEHSDTERITYKLAKCYMSQGKYSDAEPLFKRILAVCEECFGSKDPGTAILLRDLAKCYMSQAKYSKAEPLLVQAKAIYEVAWGLEHSDTVASLHDLAKCYMGLGRYIKAESLLVQAKDSEAEPLLVQVRAIRWERQKDQEEIKKLATKLEAAYEFLIKEEGALRELRYKIDDFKELYQETCSHLEDVSRVYKTTNIVDQRTRIGNFKTACQPIFKIYRHLKNFLQVDANIEETIVKERSDRIKDLLKQLPETRPTLRDLPRQEWWKVYIDAPMHKEAKELSDPGKLFDNQESPGYQQSMMELFEKVLELPQMNEHKNMDYKEYTEIHKLATKYVPDDKQKLMHQLNGISTGEIGGCGCYTLSSKEDGISLRERVAALREMSKELINGLPLFQDCPSRQREFHKAIMKYEQIPKGITMGLVLHDPHFISPSSGQLKKKETGSIIMANAYLIDEGPQHVNAILGSYYEGRKISNQTQDQRLREIARATRALHVLHPKGDGNGRTNIYGFMNKCLIEEGFCPAILPNGPEVFGGMKTLDGLVEDMLVGMHSYIKEVNRHK